MEVGLNKAYALFYESKQEVFERPTNVLISFLLLYSPNIRNHLEDISRNFFLSYDATPIVDMI